MGLDAAGDFYEADGERAMKIEYRIITIAIVLGLLAWALDAAVGSFIFQSAPFWNALILNVSREELYERVIAMVAALSVGLIVSRIAARRKQIEDALREREERLRLITDNMLDTVGQISAEGVFQYVSPSHKSVLGYAPEEMAGKSFYDFVYPEDVDKARTALEMALETGSGGTLEVRCRHADGHPVWLEASGNLLFGEDDSVSGAVFSSRDVTERKRTEEALRESETRYRSLVETSPDAITLTGLDGQVIMMNRQAARLYGFDSVEEVLAAPRNAFDFIAPQDRQRAIENAKKTLEQGSVQNAEYMLLRRDGSSYPAEMNASLIRGVNGEPHAFIGVVRDITRRKRAQEALELRVEQLTALSRASQAVTASLELDQVLAEIVSLASGVVAANYTGVVLVDETGHLGQSAENLPGVPALEYRIRDEGLTHWIVHSCQAAVLDKIGEDGTIIPDLGEGAPRSVNPSLVETGVKSLAGLPLLVKDRLLGVLYLYSLHPDAFHDQLPLLTAFANQVAIAVENARLHEELQDYARQLEQWVQERTAQLQAQYARLEAILDSASDGIVVADGAGEILQANPVADAWLGMGAHMDAPALSPEDAARLQEAVCDLAHGVQERPEKVLELAGLDLELRAAPIAEPGLEGAAVVIAIHDVSHLKALDRMKSEFVSNVSHELRTPITAIKLYAALMQDALPDKLPGYLNALTQEANWQARLVEDILHMSRIDSGRLDLKPCLASLNTLVEMVVVGRQTLAGERGLTLEYRLGESEPHVLVDVDRMGQVLINLVMNAIQYTLDRGKVVVSTGEEETEGRMWATVTVADTGIGIPEDELSYIFERFFRGERPRTMQISGTGLGLAIVKEIVELHGGRVTAASQVGVGSVFTVWLPLAE
jgi:PAS domain S-box-containing protein